LAGNADPTGLAADLFVGFYLVEGSTTFYRAFLGPSGRFEAQVIAVRR
jgi:hypothetical protein